MGLEPRSFCPGRVTMDVDPSDYIEALVQRVSVVNGTADVEQVLDLA